MAKKGSVGSSLGGLRKLAEALAAVKGGRVDVGIFAGEDARTASGGAGSKPGFYKPGTSKATIDALQRGDMPPESAQTNAEIGAKMEFGVSGDVHWIDRKGIPRMVKGIPPRSFLRSPMHLHGDRILKKAKADVAEKLKEAPKNPKRAAKMLLDRVGIAAEQIVDDAFNTQGDGDWEPNSPVTQDAKGSATPLIDTGQLRRSISSRAVL